MIKAESRAQRVAEQTGAPAQALRLQRMLPQLLLLPTTLVLLAVTVYPIVYGAYLSVFDLQMTRSQTMSFVGLANYQELLATESGFLNSIWVTVLFTIMTVGSEFAIGMGLALLLNLEFPMRALFRTLVLIPLMVPPLVSGLLWRLMYDHEFGILSFFVRSMGVEPPVFLGDPRTALFAVAVTEIWRATPFLTLVLLASLQAVPGELQEAAQVDGAGRFGIFRRITFPLILPALLVALLFRTVDVLRTFDLVYLLTQGGPGSRTEVVGMYIYRYGFESFNMGLTSAASMLLFLFTLLICVFYLRLILRRQAAMA